MRPLLILGTLLRESSKGTSILEMPPSRLGVCSKTLKHTGSIRDYIKRYTDLVLQVSDMSNRDLLFKFISNLSP